MFVNDHLRKTEKEEKEEEGWGRPCRADDLETKAVFSFAPTAQTNTIIDEEKPRPENRPLALLTRAGAGPSFQNTEKEKGREGLSQALEVLKITGHVMSSSNPIHHSLLYYPPSSPQKWMI